MLDDPKAGYGALLHGRGVTLAKSIPGFKGDDGKVVTSKINASGQYEYSVAFNNRGRVTLFEKMARESFRVKDPLAARRAEVKRLLEEQNFEVIPTPMCFPDLEHPSDRSLDYFLGNPIFGKDVFGAYFLVLFGCKDSAVRKTWKSFVRENVFVDQKCAVHFIGKYGAFAEAQAFTSGYQAGLHCLSSENPGGFYTHSFDFMQLSGEISPGGKTKRFRL